MRNNKENQFAYKFRLLNSQECSDDINWSTSSSNDEENRSSVTFCNLRNRRRYTKRKRKNKIDNLPNLDITVIESSSPPTGNKSPILCNKSRIEVSPVLGSKLIQRSPILISRSSRKSPILQNCGKVNRKLFKYDNGESFASNLSACETNCKNSVNKTSNSCDSVEHSCVPKINVSSSSDTHSEKNSKHAIYKNVKKFFDSYFTSDNASQNSISDTTTPKDSIQSDEVEISSGTTDYDTSNINLNKHSPEPIKKDITKKVKYKKGGNAYRLDVLLKKQNASHSLWLHERYLADNSNFVIPKEEHLIFRVKAIESEYGSTILSAIDEKDVDYYIIINDVYLIKKIVCDSVIKVYKPYTIIECGSHRVILNVCKYDNLAMKIDNT